jgi:hypothetical protein
MKNPAIGMFDFNSMVDQHLKREHKPKGIGRYYPSEIGSCMRKTWYSYNFPKEVEPTLLRIFEMGNILHDFVVEVLSSEKTPEVELLHAELPVKMELEGFTVSGRVDNLLLIKRSGKQVLVEVKSTSNVDYVKGPQISHIRQLQFYMLATNVHSGALLYVDKRNLKSKVFDVLFSQEEADEVLERFKRLHSSLKKEKIPSAEAREDERIKWMCKFCEHKEKCDKD